MALLGTNYASKQELECEFLCYGINVFVQLCYN